MAAIVITAVNNNMQAAYRAVKNARLSMTKKKAAIIKRFFIKPILCTSHSVRCAGVLTVQFE